MQYEKVLFNSLEKITSQYMENNFELAYLI